MIYTVINGSIDLAQGLQLTHLKSALVTEDSKAHRIVITVSRNGASENLTGATITGSFVRADGITVPISGEAEQNTAIVTLPQECYREEGRCVLAIKATMDDVISTLYLADGVVTRSATGSFVADEETALSLEELFRRLDAGVASVEASAELAAQAAEDAQVAIGGADAVARAEAAATAAEAVLERLEGIDVTALVKEIDELRAATTPALLWSTDNEDGWASGKQTVAGIQDWYLVDIETTLGHAIAINTGTTINGGFVTRYGSTANSQRTISVVITVNVEELTLESALALRHITDADHGTIGTTSIKSITGIMKYPAQK